MLVLKKLPRPSNVVPFWVCYDFLGYKLGLLLGLPKSTRFEGLGKASWIVQGGPLCNLEGPCTQSLGTLGFG